ncbi:ATP-binding protein [Burkholderia cenocepacia]|uniref:ATP-binding protein n=1 Tax=Burkholderia cenocepacia TaxID=95486 RepID=UPI002AB1A120|nr:transporter substrate-binding domain-containing protein [Burkholderia cenocepacia]
MRLAALIAKILPLTFVLLWSANASAFSLNNEEIKWIETHRIIRYAIDPYWQPIEYLDNGKPSGLTISYLNEIADIAGVDMQFVRTSSWKESMKLLADGKVDVLPGVPDFDTPENLFKRMTLSPPYFVAATIAITNARNRIISDVSDFSADDVIAIRGGGAYESWMRKNYPSLKIKRFNSTEDALNAVATGDATATIGPEPILHTAVRQRFSRTLFVAGAIPNLPLVLRIGSDAASPELRSIIQKALSNISAEKSDAIQEKWIEDADFGRPSSTVLMRYYGSRIVILALTFISLVIALLQIWKARRAISEIAKQRAAFLSIMAHEIRNPLNYILASIELAGKQTERDKMMQYIEIATRGGESLVSLLSDALNFSKMDGAEVIINKTAIKPIDLLSPLLPAFEIDAQKKGLKFTSIIPENLTAPLLVDEIKMRQVLTNIVSNAIKFTCSGSVALSIATETTHHGEYLKFRVSDTGIGIPQDAIDQIFLPFFQVSEGGSVTGGIGLGLAICDKIVSAMNGTLSVHSAIGEGTVVTVKIPLERSNDIELKFPKTSNEENPSTAKVLVVEDVETNRTIIGDQLVHLGYLPILAESGQVAINEIDRQKFDIVLLDCNLPDISGYDVARHIRNSIFPGASATPIIAISADVDANHIGMCLDSGMDGVLAKPVSMMKLKETLSAWLSGERKHSDFSAPNLEKIRDVDIFNGMRSEALEILRCAMNDDADGISFYSHRLKGIAMTFGHLRYLEFIPSGLSSEIDFRKIRRDIIKLIREIDARQI